MGTATAASPPALRRSPLASAPASTARRPSRAMSERRLEGAMPPRPSEQDAERAEVREAAERVARDDDRAAGRASSRRLVTSMLERDELVEDHLHAEQLADGGCVVPGHAQQEGERREARYAEQPGLKLSPGKADQVPPSPASMRVEQVDERHEHDQQRAHVERQA